MSYILFCHSSDYCGLDDNFSAKLMHLKASKESQAIEFLEAHNHPSLIICDSVRFTEFLIPRLKEINFQGTLAVEHIDGKDDLAEYYPVTHSYPRLEVLEFESTIETDSQKMHDRIQGILDKIGSPSFVAAVSSQSKEGGRNLGGSTNTPIKPKTGETE